MTEWVWIDPITAIALHDRLLILHGGAAGVLDEGLMLSALAINVVLLLASFAAFLALLRSARRHGSLLGGGE